MVCNFCMQTWHSVAFRLVIHCMSPSVRSICFPEPADTFTMGRAHYSQLIIYEGGSICNENPFITPSTNTLGFYVICQTKDQSVAVKMVHETLFYLTNFSKLQTF